MPILNQKYLGNEAHSQCSVQRIIKRKTDHHQTHMRAFIPMHYAIPPESVLRKNCLTFPDRGLSTGLPRWSYAKLTYEIPSSPDNKNCEPTQTSLFPDPEYSHAPQHPFHTIAQCLIFQFYKPFSSSPPTFHHPTLWTAPRTKISTDQQTIGPYTMQNQ